MTPTERRQAVEQAVAKHGWDIADIVVDYVVAQDRFEVAEQVEAILMIGLDIANLRGQPLSVEILAPMLAPPEPPSRTYPDEVSAIFMAIEDGLVDELRDAVADRTANLEEINDYHEGMTPLLLALFQRDLSMAEILVEAGADVHNRGRYPDAPIHLATLGSGSKRLQLLLAAGADPDSRDRNGRTPLMLLADDDRHLEQVAALLAARASTALIDADGATALAIAERHGAKGIAALLQSRGA